MALIDKLLDRAFDEATHSYRARRDRSERQRDELVAALRSYSTEIERMRIGYLRLRDDLHLGGTGANLWIPATPALPAGIDERDGSPSDESAERRQAALVAHEQAQLSLEAAIPLVVGLRGTVATWQDAQSRNAELDDEWARLRPLLDDSLEIETVEYLRAFRHDLRYLVRFAHASIVLLGQENHMAAQFELRQKAINAIENVLLAADLWNAHVAGVRRGVAD